MADQVVDADTARRLHAQAIRASAMTAWIVFGDQPAYPGKFLARLATTEPTPYVLLADTISELRDALPGGLHHSDRMPADPEGVVEIWFSPGGAGP